LATLKQALAILLATSEPPWSTHSLGAIFQARPLSLRKLLKAVDAQKVILFLEIGPISLLNGVSTGAELIGKWSSEKATKQTLDDLLAIFRPLGISIVYVSKDAQTIGIRGTNQSLLQIQALKLFDPNASPGGQNQSGLGNLAQGLAAGAAGGAALAGSGALVGGAAAILVIVGFVGFAAAGLFLAVGIYQLMAGAADSKPPTVSATAASGSDESETDFSLADGILGLVPDNLALDFIENFFENIIDGVPEPGELPGAGDLSPSGPDLAVG
jgi:hypothetical protein